MFGVWPAARSQKSFYKAAASNMLGSFSTTLRSMSGAFLDTRNA